RAPALISLTMRVPALVPSDVQSSPPCEPSLAKKKSRPPDGVRNRGPDPPDPLLISATICVPAALPLDFHSSNPCTPSLAAKNSEPLRTADGCSGGSSAGPTMLASACSALAGPGLTSTTRCVPAALPSVDHSSNPCTASL